MPHLFSLGSACVSHVGDGVPPSRTFPERISLKQECFGVTPKPARETRALPGIL
jgi:hypothetical protein